jgi:hypothetical protein
MRTVRDKDRDKDGRLKPHDSSASAYSAFLAQIGRDGASKSRAQKSFPLQVGGRGLNSVSDDSSDDEREDGGQSLAVQLNLRSPHAFPPASTLFEAPAAEGEERFHGEGVARRQKAAGGAGGLARASDVLQQARKAKILKSPIYIDFLYGKHTRVLTFQDWASQPVAHGAPCPGAPATATVKPQQ